MNDGRHGDADSRMNRRQEGDRATEIIRRGDPAEIIGMALAARMAAEEGEFCECKEPALHGLDLMCGHCLYENRDQIKRREKAMREPHSFQPDPDKDSGAARLGMCRLCARWEDDPRHIREERHPDDPDKKADEE